MKKMKDVFILLIKDFSWMVWSFYCIRNDLILYVVISSDVVGIDRSLVVDGWWDEFIFELYKRINVFYWY